MIIIMICLFFFGFFFLGKNDDECIDLDGITSVAFDPPISARGRGFRGGRRRPRLDLPGRRQARASGRLEVPGNSFQPERRHQQLIDARPRLPIANRQCSDCWLRGKTKPNGETDPTS